MTLPATPSTKRIFISYSSKDLHVGLAQRLHDQLEAAGHQPFLAGASIEWGESWPERVAIELNGCDYFLLLLSQAAAASDMVIDEVRRAKTLRDASNGKKPIMLTLRVALPKEALLPYDLTGYLSRTQQKTWGSDADTQSVMQDLLTLLSDKVSSGFRLMDPSESTDHMAIETNMEAGDQAPAPMAPPELPEGQVKLDSKYYIARPEDGRCYEAIRTDGALIRIKAARQMGKTSLMSRILREATQQGCQSVALTFQLADRKVFSDLDLFLRRFCASVGRRLQLPNRLDSYWDKEFGSKENCTIYFEEYLLQELGRPLALGLDEVDLIMEHPDVAAEFFGMLRAWHDGAKNEGLWTRLRLIVVHSTEVYVPLSMNESPFNVGLPIDLPEFTDQQISELLQRYQLQLTAAQLAALRSLLGGHPYLIRLTFYVLARHEISLDHLLRTAATEAGIYGDHLLRHMLNLDQHPVLARAMKRVATATDPVRLASVEAFQLESMGLVLRDGNDVCPRCELYRSYFRDRLRNVR